MARLLDLRVWWLLGPAGSAWAAAPAEARFTIQALGDRCWEVAEPRDKGDGSISIQPCDRSEAQMFRLQELDATHDFQILTASGSGCVGIVGATAPGATLSLQSCSPTPGRRFAFDGDALLVGTQGRNERVSRDFVLEPLEANTNAGTRVVVGSREVNDAEYWRIVSIDDPALRPHSGFVPVENDTELGDAVTAATWGSVIELAPTASNSIPLHKVPLPLRLAEGVTLRGGRKWMDNGIELVLPPSRPLTGETVVLDPQSQARITALRLMGHDIPEEDDAPDTTYGVRIGTGLSGDPAVRDVIVDHIDISHWSDSAIAVIGPYRDLPHEECPSEREDRPMNQIIGNFIHHNQRDYGVAVYGGGGAVIQGNLMFLNSHDVTSGFYNGANRYFVLDGLFTGEDSDFGTSALLDVHGSCDLGHWNGGRGGDLFEAAYNSFLTERGPVVSIRATPCDHFGFHDNVVVQPEDVDTMSVEPGEPGDESCPDADGSPFVPGLPEEILLSHDNTFDAVNPLSFGVGEARDLDDPYAAGDLGVGDFDGDGHDDVFLGTGVTWWFSSGGAAEWRLLNRMPERASELRFGDFDHDGRTDVVALHGYDLEVSWAGGSDWFPLNSLHATFAITDLAVGQFDADPRDDLFLADGELWTWSSGGSSGWDFFAYSGYRTPELRFGTFIGNDGLTDVFGVVGDLWMVVDGPGSHWTELREALADIVEAFVVADFDGDGVSDVAHAETNDTWLISWSGTSPYDEIVSKDQPLPYLPIGNFDAEPGADVLIWSNERWLNIVSEGRETEYPWSRQSMR
jgi:hypothetical protein